MMYPPLIYVAGAYAGNVSAIDSAPLHVRAKVIRLREDGSTQQQIADYLEEQGILVSTATVGYHLRKNGRYTDRKWWATPADTFPERMLQYLAALNAYPRESFRLWDLGLKDRAWGRCTTYLLRCGIISKEMHRWYKKSPDVDERIASLEQALSALPKE